MAEVVLVGRVVSGSGDLAKWMTRYAGPYAAAVGGPLHPGTLEILSAVCLRAELGLTDGDEVEVVV